MYIMSGPNHLAKHSERGRSQGRQKKRWEDSMREWTSMEFAKSQWRKLVVKSSVVLQ